MKKQIEDHLDEFLKNAVELKKHCDGITSEECTNGVCQFYDKKSDECLFRNMGFDAPFEWLLDRKGCNE